MDAATIIEAESRELIRRRGLDVHADQLEPLIREVVADYDRRSSSGEVPVLHDDDTMVAQVAARIGASATPDRTGSPIISPGVASAEVHVDLSTPASREAMTTGVDARELRTVSNGICTSWDT